MKNLFRTLIPYKWTALLVLLLMAGQAFCEMNLPQYTAKGLLAEKNIADIGYVHMVTQFAGWTSVNTFNVKYTIMTADGVSAVNLTASCKITAGVLGVVSIS